MSIPFNVNRIIEYVDTILIAAGLPIKHSRQFVELSLERKKRFWELGFDEFGRRHIPFTVTPGVLLNDYTWFRQLLEQTNIKTEKLAVMMGKIFVLTARGGGAPLTKELSKIKDQLFTSDKSWWNSYEFKAEILNKPDVFLARLGDVINLGKKAVISINPGDILRKSMGGIYSAYTSCHNLADGGYRQGPVNYCLDKAHMVTYITDGGDTNEKMHGRSMLVISNDLNVVAMRRFYPSPEVFGESRAKAIREAVHRSIAPGINWKRSRNTNILQPSTAPNGYADQIAVATYLNPDKQFTDVELCTEVFCFGCGKIHHNRALMCGSMTCRQGPIPKPARATVRRFV